MSTTLQRHPAWRGPPPHLLQDLGPHGPVRLGCGRAPLVAWRTGSFRLGCVRSVSWAGGTPLRSRSGVVHLRWSDTLGGMC